MDDDKIIGNNGNDTPLNEEAKNKDGNAANTDDYTDVVANRFSAKMERRKRCGRATKTTMFHLTDRCFCR